MVELGFWQFTILTSLNRRKGNLHLNQNPFSKHPEAESFQRIYIWPDFWFNWPQESTTKVFTWSEKNTFSERWGTTFRQVNAEVSSQISIEGLFKEHRNNLPEFLSNAEILHTLKGSWNQLLKFGFSWKQVTIHFQNCLRSTEAKIKLENSALASFPLYLGACVVKTPT